MDKIQTLSLKDAFANFTQRKNTNKDSGNNLKITLTIPTHRVSPDYKQDNLALKNQINNIETRLATILDKKETQRIVGHIKDAEKTIDYSRNQDSLVLYADNNSVSIVKLPVHNDANITIGEYFDVRPLYKAVQQREHYYIITISQQKIRLIEASNDRVIEEFNDGNLPFENTEYFTTNPKKLAQDKFTDNLIKEFYNEADKRIQVYMADNPLPVFLAGDIKSVSHYKEMMDDTSMVVNTVHGNYDGAPTHEIVKDIHPLLMDYSQSKQDQYISEIGDAQNKNLAVFDINDIYQTALAGNTQTLYIEDGFSLSGTINNDIIEIELNPKGDNNIEELTLPIIEKVQDGNGNIVILEKGIMNSHMGILLVKRYL